MKKLMRCILISLCLICSTILVGQSSQEIIRDGNTITYKNNSYHHKNAEFLFSKHTESLEHYKLYMRMHTRKNFKRNAGLILMSAGVGLHLLTNRGSEKLLYHERVARSLPLILFGTVGGILLFNSFSRPYTHFDNAIASYKSSSTSYLNLSTSANGLGLVYNF